MYEGKWAFGYTRHKQMNKELLCLDVKMSFCLMHTVHKYKHKKMHTVHKYKHKKMNTDRYTHKHTHTEDNVFSKEKPSSDLLYLIQLHRISGRLHAPKHPALPRVPCTMVGHYLGVPLLGCETFSSAMSHCSQSTPAAKCPSV